MNLPFGMLLAGLAGYTVWFGISDPAEGFWGGLAALMQGKPITKRTSTTGAAFTSEIAALVGSGGTTSSAGGGAFPATGNVSGSRGTVISTARTWLGVPYKFGGESKSTGADCSGFTQQVFKSVGVNLPRTAAEQQTVGRSVAMSAAQPGDLIFFGMPAHHVGIYLGNNQIIHEPHTGTVCKVETIWNEAHTARDVLGLAPARPNKALQGAAA